MGVISVIVRKEKVQCLQCNKPNDFIFLSDFSYGERLAYSDHGIPFAFARLIEDKVYDEFEELVRKILLENTLEIDEEKVNTLVIETFGIACDEIDGCIIDFSHHQNKCCFCGSTNYNRNMMEPESLVKIEVQLISHKNWTSMEYMQKYELVKNELTDKLNSNGARPSV